MLPFIYYYKNVGLALISSFQEELSPLLELQPNLVASSNSWGVGTLM
jgi:hypothetical protein